jgi:hypothetical protein
MSPEAQLQEIGYPICVGNGFRAPAKPPRFHPYFNCGIGLDIAEPISPYTSCSSDVDIPINFLVLQWRHPRQTGFPTGGGEEKHKATG